MTERIELRFVGGYDEDEFIQGTAYWVSDTDGFQLKVRDALGSLINKMQLFKNEYFCIGQIIEFEGHKVHLVFEREAY